MEEMMISVRAHGAVGDGSTVDTKAFQAAINAVGANGKVIVEPGQYLVGSIFLKSDMEFHLQEGAVLLGSKDIRNYPLIFSRVAGIEMDWPAAIVNVFDKKNVQITGTGIIDGQGEYWWDKYWGTDGHGGLRKIYDSKNLRWVADYEIQRPRMILVFNSENVEIQDFTAQRSGFWTVQITYSNRIHIHDIVIKDNLGPSTDGVDIDSSRQVLIENCVVSCNDDDIVIKSGRDADGLRVNRICEDIEIRDCTILSGAGITLGSEVAGGIRNIRIHNISFKNTDCGFRIKSSRFRGGFIENIFVENLKMLNVQFPFSWLMDWFPEYNKMAILPEKLVRQHIPEYWKKIIEPVPIEKQGTHVKDIRICNVVSDFELNYDKSSRAFDIQGFVDKPMKDIFFENVKIRAGEFGNIIAVENFQLKNVVVSAKHCNQPENDIYDHR